MSQAIQSDYQPGESSSVQDDQKVLEGKGSSTSTCSLIAWADSFDTVMAGSKPDCKHCSARKEAIIRLIPDAATRLAAKGEIRWTSHDITSQYDKISVHVPQGQTELDSSGLSEYIELFFLENNFDSSPFSPDDSDEGSNLRRIPPLDTSSEASLQFALSCIRECTKNHADCGSDLEQPLPTRVLFVGTSESPTLYLHESTGQSSRYVCLSYCWGEPSKTSSMLQTTTKTVDSFKTQIPWFSLPKTFRDAIYFTRRLGIEYIWIDSLCIIQDDGEDKAHEIGQMANVYSNAFLTIAATSASSPLEGLFSTTSNSYIAEELPKSVWDPDHSDYGPLYARRKMPHPWDSWGLDQNFPLLKRGWVFQERCLSPRVLHFTEQELIWECMSASGCECRSRIRPLERHKRDLIPLETSMDRMTRDSTWERVVAEYSSMLLTYDADTLPGLSGLASVWQTLYPDQYLSGLWRSSLVKGLIWRKVGSCPKPPEYQAPSWSWASYPIGTISHFERHLNFHELAQISDAYCVPTHDVNPTGMVSGGYIKLAAKAAPGKLRFRGSSALSPVYFHGTRAYVSLDSFPESEELDVYMVAIGTSSVTSIDEAIKTLHFLVLSSNGGHPETFQRRGVSHPRHPKTRWTADAAEWWTSKAEDGWMEFTIV